MSNVHALAHSLYVSGHSDFVGLMTVWTNTAVCPLVMADLFMDLHMHEHASGVKWVLSQPKRPVFSRQDRVIGPFPLANSGVKSDHLYWFRDGYIPYCNCVPELVYNKIVEVASWTPFNCGDYIIVPNITLGLLALLDGLVAYEKENLITTKLTDWVSQSRLLTDTATGVVI